MPGPVFDLSIYADEDTLLAGLRRHDPDACTCLVKRFAPLVYTRALRLVGDPDDAESVLQTTFMKVCDALPGFDELSSLGTWIYRIATNEGLMLLRQRKPRISLDDIVELVQPDNLAQPHQSRAIDPGHAAINGELRVQLEQAISTLPESLRVVVLLRDLAELSTEETAAQLGLTPGAMKVRLHRARLRLRELLSSYLEGAADGD